MPNSCNTLLHFSTVQGPSKSRTVNGLAFVLFPGHLTSYLLFLFLFRYRLAFIIDSMLRARSRIAALASVHRGPALLCRPKPSLVQRTYGPSRWQLQKRLYHDNEVYGYRIPKEYQMPDYTPEELANRMKYGSLLRLVQAYRTYGHKAAHLDPLDIMQRE